MEKEIYLTIGPVSYRLHSDIPISPQEDCANFFHTNKELLQPYCIDCEIKVNTRPIEVDGKIVKKNANRVIFDQNGLERRFIIFNNQIVGVYKELDDKHITVIVHDYGQPEIIANTSFLELIALERHLLKENAMVLHSAFIEYKGKSILFTAPSGTGKSTQAALWEKYEKVETINGDRSIVHLKNGKFYSEGLPFCGSSEIHVNKTMPLGAIVFIEQWPTNIVESMKPNIAASKLYGEMTVNSWNTQSVLKSFDIIEKLITSAPMVRFRCNMEQDAVNTLKNFLHEDSKF